MIRVRKDSVLPTATRRDSRYRSTMTDSEENEGEGEFLEGEAPTVDEPAPDSIVELYQACIGYVKVAVGIELDFSPETLPILDHYLTISRESLVVQPTVEPLLTRAVGAYFGELVRRQINGFWRIPSVDAATWRICGHSAYFAFNPVGMVTECLMQNEEGSGPGGEIRLARHDRRLIAERLALMPEVKPDEYYLLSTKLEVIEVIAETLQMATEQGEGGGTRYEAEDYEYDLEVLGES
jgi:hypothetical protein